MNLSPLFSLSYDEIDPYGTKLIASPLSDTKSGTSTKSLSSSSSIDTSSVLKNFIFKKNSIKNKKIIHNELFDSRCFVPLNERIPHNERDTCYVCTRYFSPFRHKHTCRMCGEVICKKCSLFKRVHIHVGENKVRVCSGCVILYRKGKVSSNNINCLSSSLEPPNPIDNVHNSPQKVSVTENNDGTDPKKSTNSEAFLRAEALEKEVQKGNDRINELETTIKRINNETISSGGTTSEEQEKELNEARMIISTLQKQLQEKVQILENEKVRNENEFFGSSDEVAIKLRRKVIKMERQLQQAGLNIVQDIPYEEAKNKIKEISKRMNEIGSSEIVCEDKKKQANLRKEYFILEQDMEKYNSALMLTDEFIAEQEQFEQEWNRKHESKNREALKQIRKNLPINISQLSEKQLLQLAPPNSKKSGQFSINLARRLKRTNVLELLRVSPLEIQKMHPSVIESYRTTGLSILERRALHCVLKAPFAQWKRQKQEDSSYKKYSWYCKMYDKLKSMIEQNHHHIEEFSNFSVSSTESSSKHCYDNEEGIKVLGELGHSCNFIGNQCPVRRELNMNGIYSIDLGYPTGDIYLEKEVLKSDPENAGRKALAEAKAYSSLNTSNQRLNALKSHYGMNMQEVTFASGAIEEMDEFVEKVDGYENSWAQSAANNKNVSSSEYASLIQEVKVLCHMISKRAGINLLGKRDITKDGFDNRSLYEIQFSTNVILYSKEVVVDLKNRLVENMIHKGILNSIESLENCMAEIQRKNKLSEEVLLRGADYNSSSRICRIKRQTWNQRFLEAQKLCLDIKNKSQVVHKKKTNGEILNQMKGNVTRDIGNKLASTDMLAAIRARKIEKSQSKSPVCPIGLSGDRNALLSAIKLKSKNKSMANLAA